MVLFHHLHTIKSPRSAKSLILPFKHQFNAQKVPQSDFGGQSYVDDL
jgi:hypothetical protein